MPRPRPCRCPRTFVLDGVELPVRANLGILRPADFIHRPAGGGVPVPLQSLQIGVQIVAAPRRCASPMRLSQRVSFAVIRLSLEAAT